MLTTVRHISSLRPPYRLSPLVLLGVALVCGGWSLAASSAMAREWTDKSGMVTQEGELVDFDDRLVVLRKTDGRLVAVPLEDLSEADREYLATREAKAEMEAGAAKEHVWTLVDGEKIPGKVVRYGRREVVIERKGGRLMIDGRPLAEVPELERSLLPQIVAQKFERPIRDMRGVEAFVVSNRGRITMELEGVVLELENREQVALPFSVFSKRDLNVLQPGWDEWLAAEKDELRQQEQSTLLRTLASEYQRNKEIEHNIRMLQLTSQWFDLWEVVLIAPNGAQTSVVVPAQNSFQAQQTAHQQCPICSIGPTFRIRRRGF